VIVPIIFVSNFMIQFNIENGDAVGIWHIHESGNIIALKIILVHVISSVELSFYSFAR